MSIISSDDYTKNLVRKEILLDVPTSEIVKYFTKIVDVDLKILSELNDRDLLKICTLSKYFNNLCDNEDFWRNRFINRYGTTVLKYKGFSLQGENWGTKSVTDLKPSTWRKIYLSVITDTERYKKDPWNFFENIRWYLNDYNKPQFTYWDGKSWIFTSLETAPDWIKNNYYFLDLDENEITLKFPREPDEDSYDEDDDNFIEETYTATTNFTPISVIKLIYDFYYNDYPKISRRWGPLFFEGFKYDIFHDYFVLKISATSRWY